MGINKNQLEQLIINTLMEIKLCSPSAVNLLLGTAAQESHMGKYIKQLQGPAVGIFQMEPATHDDIWDNYLKYISRSTINNIYNSAKTDFSDSDMLEYNLKYAIIMCRLHYRRVKERLPKYDDLNALAQYWKKYYNTWMGKGTTEQFINNFERFVL